MKTFCLLTLLSFHAFSLSAQSELDSIKAIIERAEMDSIYFKNLYHLGIEFERKDSEKSIFYFRKNISEADPHNTTLWTGLSKIRLAGVYSAIGEKESAKHYFDFARKYVEQHPDQLRARYQYFTGLGIHQNRYGHYFEALASYAEVEKMDIEVLGKRNLAGNYLNMFNVYRRLGMVEEEFETLFKSLAIFEEIQHPVGLSYCYNALGNLYYDKKEYDKAEEYFMKSYDLRIVQEDKRGEAVVLGNLGNVMMDSGRFQEAIEAYRKAGEIHESFDFKDQWSNMQVNLGMVHLKQNQADSALFYFETARDLLLSHNENADKSKILTEMGKAYRMKNNFSQAERKFKEALDKAYAHINPKARRYIYSELGELYSEKKDFESALTYTRLFHQVHDSLDNADLKLKFQNLEAQYAFDKKDAEITLLTTENELAQMELEKHQARQFSILLILILVVVIALFLINHYRMLNRTKRLLEIEKMRVNIAQDLHDDVGSVLSSIQIMSKVAQKQDLGTKTVSLRKIEHQAAIMMDKLDDIVWSLKTTSENMNELVDKMKEFASELLEPLDIAIEFEGLKLLRAQNMDLERRKNLYLIFKEALNNAAKYSQCTTIMVSFLANGHPGTFQLIISDNGQGFDMQKISKGNGLSHINKRAQKINGSLKITSELTKGTRLALDLASHH